MIHKRDSGEVMMDAAADLSFSRQPTLIRAPRAQAGEQTVLWNPRRFAGGRKLAMLATIRQGAKKPASSAPSRRNATPSAEWPLWPYLTLPLVAILLFAMNSGCAGELPRPSASDSSEEVQGQPASPCGAMQVRA
jgi:hypothetical protein